MILTLVSTNTISIVSPPYGGFIAKMRKRYMSINNGTIDGG